MLTRDHHYRVVTDEYDEEAQRRATKWLYDNRIDFVDFYDGVQDARVFAFREIKWATIFKLMFHPI